MLAPEAEIAPSFLRSSPTQRIDLGDLAPKDGFVSTKSVERAARLVGEAQKAARCVIASADGEQTFTCASAHFPNCAADIVRICGLYPAIQRELVKFVAGFMDVEGVSSGHAPGRLRQ